MSLELLRIRLLLFCFCGWIYACWTGLYAQPVCSITGGSDAVCSGSSTTWSAPENMAIYSWSGPSGFTATSREITISIEGEYILTVSDLNGTSSCSRNLVLYPELSPGSINTTLRQFCVGGTAAIGGTNPPYGPATGGSGSYVYTWQIQEGCSGLWNDIPESNTTSFTPVPPPVTTCYRRKVTDTWCSSVVFSGSKEFEIFEDPVSQTIIPMPVNLAVCAGYPISATFTGGSGGFPGGTTDIYEYTSNSGVNWLVYVPEENIPSQGLSGTNVVRIRTRRISSGVNGCNYGTYVTASWSVNPLPVTTAIFHR